MQYMYTFMLNQLCFNCKDGYNYVCTYSKCYRLTFSSTSPLYLALQPPKSSSTSLTVSLICILYAETRQNQFLQTHSAFRSSDYSILYYSQGVRDILVQILLKAPKLAQTILIRCLMVDKTGAPGGRHFGNIQNSRHPGEMSITVKQNKRARIMNETICILDR